MAWIESHQDLAHHPKTHRLTGRLGVHHMQAIGHLHALWWWCLSYADDGDLSEFDDFEIARGAGWEDDPAVFVSALTAAGWLDEDRTVHDWHDYAGKLVERRRADAERKAQARRKPSPQTPPPRPEDVQRTTDGRRADGVRTQPNRTQPNPTEPEPLAPKPARARDPIWDALTAVFGEPTTRTAQTLRGKVAVSLKQAGAGPGDVVDRARTWPLHFPDATLTETALEKHWDRLGRPPLKLSSGQVEQLADRQRSASRLARADELDRKALGS